MGSVESAHERPHPGVSRRRILQVLAATAAVTPFARLAFGIDRADAAAPAWQPPPPYDSIVGLL
ncbi:hypothetical protein JCM18899A_30260 [Nocardioides sp. AN3]